MLLQPGLRYARLAQAFVDYLQTQGIEAQLHQEAGLYFIALQQQNAQAEVYYQEFLLNPQQEKYLAASWQQDPATAAQFSYRGGSFWRALQPYLQPFTLAISMLCLVVFISLQWDFARTYAALRIADIHGQIGEPWWRWLTPTVLHFSLLHLLMNVSWWVYLGGQLERYQRLRLLAVFVVTGLASNVAQLLWDGPDFGGLSGVVYGLTAYCYLLPLLKPQMRPIIDHRLMAFMCIMMVAMMFGVVGNIANAAHLVGLLAGGLLALADGLLTRRR